MLNKWKKAVIHLESATDSEHFYDKIKRIDELRHQLEEGRITHQQFAEALSEGSRDIRYHGTAIFLIHAGRRYLLTARHVLWDERSAQRESDEERQRFASLPKEFLQSANKRTKNNIFSIIFRVPSLDEIITKGVEFQREFLMNLGAGTSFSVPYTFSSPEIDLALVSLDQRNSRFADQLIKLGYEPISSDDIADSPTGEGSEVFTVGYPSSTALIGQVSQYPTYATWASSYYSLPVFAFGKVSMLHGALDFYWADMSICPGNSGGPVVENGKLVGIVSAQAEIPIDSVPQIRTRIPFGKIIKTGHVQKLLQIQEKKDVTFRT